MRLNTLALAALMTLSMAAQAASGPSTTQTPFLVPSAAGVDVTAILTVGDLPADNGYNMVGLPDGLGALDNRDGTFTLFMNHEINSALGSVRAHGSIGGFVSQWTIRKSDLKVLAGQDMVQSPDDVFTWNGSAWVAGTTAISRLCSADLASKDAFFNPGSGKGHKGAIFLNGEENGAEGRAFAWVQAKGKTARNQVFQLPYLGKFSWENAVANPYPQDKTVVLGTDDTSVNGQVYVYVGEKATTGNAVQKAGLHGGKLYAIKMDGNQSEDRSDLPFGSSSDRFTLVDVSASALDTGANLNAATIAAGATNFLRPEDAAWSPKNLSKAYFATTDSVVGRSRTWELTFDDITQPQNGGIFRVVGDGNNGFKMADNITVDGKSGNVLLQEDVGGDARLGKVWDLNPANGALVELAAHDGNRFLSGGGNFLTQDEESSGVIDVTALFKNEAGYDTAANRYYLLVSQAHYAIPGELVEGGQLQLMKVPNKINP